MQICCDSTTLSANSALGTHRLVAYYSEPQQGLVLSQGSKQPTYITIHKLGMNKSSTCGLLSHKCGKQAFTHALRTMASSPQLKSRYLSTTPVKLCPGAISLLLFGHTKTRSASYLTLQHLQSPYPAKSPEPSAICHLLWLLSWRLCMHALLVPSWSWQAHPSSSGTSAEPSPSAPGVCKPREEQQMES